jgi:GPI-anchor transamidase subunit S
MINRASIPSSEIAILDETPISFTLHIDVYIRDQTRQKTIINDLNSLFATNDIFSATLEEISIDPKVVENIKTPVKLEQVVMKSRRIKPGNLLIIEWGNLQEDILLSSDRTIFISDKVCELRNILL